MNTAAGMAVITENQEVQHVRNEAKKLYDVIMQDAASMKYGWVKMGRAGLRIKREELFKYLADDKGESFHSWEHLVQHVYDASRAQAFRCVQLIEALGSLDDKSLACIPISNALLLLHLSEKDRVSIVWTHRAQTMKHADLRELIFDSLDGAAKPEAKRSIEFTGVTKSLDKMVEKALTVAGFVYEAGDRNGQLEAICVDFLDHPYQDEVNLQRDVPLSNQQAFEQFNRTMKRIK